MSYLQKGHVEECFYERHDEPFLDDTIEQSCLHETNQNFLEATVPRNQFLENSTESYFHNTNVNYLLLKDAKIHYLDEKGDTGADVLLELTNEEFQEDAKDDFYEVDSNLHHLEEVIADNNFLESEFHNFLLEDEIHHLEESGGETSDEDGEDFCHKIDWDRMLPPEWKKTGKSKWKDALTGNTVAQKPLIHERFEIFDLNADELKICIARYQTKENSKQKLREMRQDDTHRSVLQPVALDMIRVWKHDTEKRILHGDMQGADYSERSDRMDVMRDETAVQRKARRQRELQEKQRRQMSDEDRRRAAQKEDFDRAESERKAEEARKRAEVEQDRLQRMEDERIAREMEMQRLMEMQQGVEEDEEKRQDDRTRTMAAKLAESRIKELLNKESTGYDLYDLPNQYFLQYDSEWQPDYWFNINSVSDLFKSSRSPLKQHANVIGNARVLARKHWEKISVFDFSVKELLMGLENTDTIDDCIALLRMQRLENERVNDPTQALSVGMGVSGLSNNHGLPAGWEVKKNNHGRLFFIDHSNHGTTWEDPRPLPSGWRSGKNAQGRTFFINDSQRVTGWDDPRPPIRI